MPKEPRGLFPRIGAGRRLWCAVSLLCVIGWVFASTEAVKAQSSPPPAFRDQVLGFADHLYDRQEYYRAVGEYRRFLFLYPGDPEAPRAALRLAACYFHGRRWQQALEEVEAFLQTYERTPLIWQARLLKARTLSGLGRWEEAGEELEQIIEADTPEAVEARARYFLGLLLGKQGRLLEADEVLRQIGSQSLLTTQAESVRQILAEARRSKRKDPLLAGTLAAILPGAGHLYCERPGDAAMAFLLTGAFAGAAIEAFAEDHEELGTGLALVSLAFYAGNIYSAANVAHKYNDRERRRLHKRLAPFEKFRVGLVPGPSLYLSLTVSF